MSRTELGEMVGYKKNEIEIFEGLTSISSELMKKLTDALHEKAREHFNFEVFENALKDLIAEYESEEKND